MIQKWQALLAKLEIFGDETNVVTAEELLVFENKTGIILPDDYKNYCQVFGAGEFGDCLRIYCPTSSSQFYLDTIKYETSEFTHVSLEELEKIVIRRQEAGGRRQEVGFWRKLVLPPKTFPLQRGGLYPVVFGQLLSNMIYD